MIGINIIAFNNNFVSIREIGNTKRENMQNTANDKKCVLGVAPDTIVNIYNVKQDAMITTKLGRIHLTILLTRGKALNVINTIMNKMI